MADQIDLRSTSFLSEARDLLQQANGLLGSHTGDAHALVNQIRQQFDQIGQFRIDELRSAQAALDSVDEEDDDGSYELARRDEAYEAVQIYRQVAQQVDEAGRRFAAKVGALSDRGFQIAKSGVAVLEQRIDALDAYRAIRLPGAAGSSAPAESGPRGGSAPANHAVQVGPAEHDLPLGFGWLNIAEVDPELGFIDDPAEFKKTDHAQMKRGLEILRDEIIPALKATGRYTREDAQRRDREGGTEYTAQGWIHPESRATIWSAFLDPRREADVVAVSRRADGVLEVSSGRHRLGLARQLGLRSIPARFIGGGSGA